MYNADGLIERVTDPSGRYVSYGYDANGNLVEVTDLNGKSTEYTYDASNRINKKTDANGNQVIRNEYDFLGRIVRQYDGKDHIQYHIYDDENHTRYLIDENGIE